ncbi:MAG: hypothetical protein ACE5JQ_17750, partial [Candidatus Methylomirabilales bacterium]
LYSNFGGTDCLTHLDTEGAAATAGGLALPASGSMARRSGMPAGTMFLTALRRRSWKSILGCLPSGRPTGKTLRSEEYVILISGRPGDQNASGSFQVVRLDSLSLKNLERKRGEVG